MPRIRVNGVELHYEDEGRGPGTVVFAHGLLWSGRLFEPQVEALRSRYRCVSFDFRGQGRSEVAAGGYDMDTLTEDTAALIEALDAAPCHFVGLSMGGFVGLRLALRRPELLRSLALLNTTADPEPPANVPRYRRLAFAARWLGPRWVAAPVSRVMFGRSFLADPARAPEREALRRRLAGVDRVGATRATRGVIERAGMYHEIHRITVPTLIVAGEEDVATPPDRSRRMAERIPGATLVVIPGAGHTSTLEAPAAVNAALEEFLAAVPAGPVA